MAAEGAGNLIQAVALLGAAVVAVPLFQRIGLGSVLGYLAAGLAIGPYGLGWFSDPQTILHTAELGVVMFLFVIGLEMRPSHLWGLRREIFGLGSLQVFACGILLTGVGVAFGFPLAVSFVSSLGFVLTSTAIVMQLLGERGDTSTPAGQKIVSILLLEDLLIVPLLATVAFLAPQTTVGTVDVSSRWVSVGVAVAALAALIAVGLWLLNPLFRILARARAREVMTAAALFVVLGAALLMQLGGLSMAMGAFVAGVLLSESSFRHQLEADIEPFRGLLLGLFFLGVGMALDLAVVARNAPLIIAGVLVMMAVKALCIYVVARMAHSNHAEALDRTVLMAQGGEFAFVLFSAALGAGVIDTEVNANMTAIVVLSMALTPLVVIAHRRWATRKTESLEGVEAPKDVAGDVLLVGFGRFGQIVSQHVLLRGARVTIIDNDPQVARDAEAFGFKVYYGDGARSDVLAAAGAKSAQVIVVCIDDKNAVTQIVKAARETCMKTRILVRAYDREHAVELMHAKADWLIRETFESAMRMGHEAVVALGATPEVADGIAEDLRRRDAERFEVEINGGLFAGRTLMIGNIKQDRHH
ncbi:MAG: monovalent cation:proton antiporter-2 (CPA2) family protein [Moraxellaceae bacterium]|nr:monovalent cation:proton antiporter-2 (CPA2) family protein [Moraxellaceae bacterium]